MQPAVVSIGQPAVVSIGQPVVVSMAKSIEINELGMNVSDGVVIYTGINCLC